jgi:hypothetical protein
MTALYPPEANLVQENSPDYQDQAAIALYNESCAHRLVGMHERLVGVLEVQTAKMEQYPATPHTASQAETITATLVAVESIQLQMARWHHLVYPNSMPR